MFDRFGVIMCRHIFSSFPLGAAPIKRVDRLPVRTDVPLCFNGKQRSFYRDTMKTNHTSQQYIFFLQRLILDYSLRFVGIGLAGYWPLAIFLLVGYTAAHLTGPSVVISILIAAAASSLTSKQYTHH